MMSLFRLCLAVVSVSVLAAPDYGQDTPRPAELTLRESVRLDSLLSDLSSLDTRKVEDVKKSFGILKEIEAFGPKGKSAVPALITFLKRRPVGHDDADYFYYDQKVTRPDLTPEGRMTGTNSTTTEKAKYVVAYTNTGLKARAATLLAVQSLGGASREETAELLKESYAIADEFEKVSERELRYDRGISAFIKDEYVYPKRDSTRAEANRCWLVMSKLLAARINDDTSYATTCLTLVKGHVPYKDRAFNLEDNDIKPEVRVAAAAALGNLSNPTRELMLGLESAKRTATDKQLSAELDRVTDRLYMLLEEQMKK